MRSVGVWHWGCCHTGQGWVGVAGCEVFKESGVMVGGAGQWWGWVVW